MNTYSHSHYELLPRDNHLPPANATKSRYGPRAFTPPLQKRSRETHDRIMRASESLLNSRDFEQISIADIAEAAEISVGNFYNRFPNKTALLYCLYENYETERTARMHEAFQPGKWSSKELEETVTGIVTVIVDLFLERTGLIRSFVSFLRDNPGFANESLQRRLMGVYRAAADLLLQHRGRIASSDVNRAANYAIWMISAMCREHILYASLPMQQDMAFSRDDFIAEFSHMILGYLLGPASPGKSNNRTTTTSETRR